MPESLFRKEAEGLSIDIDVLVIGEDSEREASPGPVRRGGGERYEKGSAIVR